MFQPDEVIFMSFGPREFKRKATGERVFALKSIGAWAFEDHKPGDWVILDKSRTVGQRLYRCPPKRFSIIYEEVENQ